jgi:hypothetical protein
LLQCWILFFFTWHTVVTLGVATCASVIILNIVYCLFFCNFGGFSSFFGLCFASHLLLHYDVNFVIFCQLAHYFCVGIVTFTLVIIIHGACYLPHFFSFVYYYVTMQAFSIFLVRELLTLINVVFLCRNLSLGLVTKARACESVG